MTGGPVGPGWSRRPSGPATSFRVREAALTAEEARAWAAAEMLRRGRRFVTVDRAPPAARPDLVVGSRLTLELVGAPFEGDGYYVTQVRHTFDHGRASAPASRPSARP